MGRIFSKRNAVIGWFAWKATRRAAQKRIDRRRRTIRLVGVASILAILIGGLSLGRGRRALSDS